MAFRPKFLTLKAKKEAVWNPPLPCRPDPSLLPPPSSSLRPAQPELKTVLLRHMTLGPDPGLLFQAVYPDLGNLGESP